MPAYLLSQDPQPVVRCDVVGKHSDVLQGFVLHVALYAADRGILRSNQEVDVVHMKPPLENPGKCHAHSVGSVPLTNDELRQIEIWIAEIADEYKHASANALRQYHIHPPYQDYPSIGIRRYVRYSCSGLILDAYRSVGIDLLAMESDKSPEVNLDVLYEAYPWLKGHDLAPYGIHGSGPWPIVLAGYVLHAMNRSSGEIRSHAYQPKLGDAKFG